MNGRHEVKHSISPGDYWELRSRLRAVLYPDSHADAGGIYTIRSLYFDDADDTALRQKLDGIRDRDKYRIRYYNNDTDFINLEKKSKRDQCCLKQSASLTKEECERILAGDIDWLNSRAGLLQELYRKMKYEGLRPQTIVDYVRDPFVYPAGNVRVTLDHDIRTGMRCTDFLDPDCVTVPVTENVIILEVKWDSYLPDIVRDAVRIPNRTASAFSKYAACRIYDF